MKIKTNSLILLTSVVLLLSAFSRLAVAQGAESKASESAEELDIEITIVKQTDPSISVDKYITLPPAASQKDRIKVNSSEKKANDKAKNTRSNAQERVNNIIGDPASENRRNNLPGDLRRVIPPKKPPKPPKPKK